jgi:hypothetical protein
MILNMIALLYGCLVQGSTFRRHCLRIANPHAKPKDLFEKEREAHAPVDDEHGEPFATP